MQSSIDTDVRVIIVNQIREGARILSKGIVDGYSLAKNALSAGDDLSRDEDIWLTYFALGGLGGFIKSRAEDFEDGERFLKDVSGCLGQIANALEAKNNLLDSLLNLTKLIHKARDDSYSMRKKK